jgi:cellulose biosynthesis protein BcsQ
MLFDDVLNIATRMIDNFNNKLTGGPLSGWELLFVRDIKGRIRIVVDDRAISGDWVPSDLNLALEEAMPGWFVGPVLSFKQGKIEEKRVVETLFRQGDSIARQSLNGVDFRLIERMQGKFSWLPQNRGKDERWPLINSRTPPVIAFYSFKGGVGRTTTLGLLAELLARSDGGKKVLCIDMDLEAPGLGEFLGAAPDKLGVLDALLAYAVESKLPPGAVVVSEDKTHGSWWQLADRPGGGEGEIWVLPAGSLTHDYLEKLGRLDFYEADGGSPVEAGLRELLKQVRTSYRPDYILIDSRAGLHEIGGVILNKISHVQFLVARGSSQNIEGMKAILSKMTMFGPLEARVRLIHTFVPESDDDSVTKVFDSALRPSFYGEPDGVPIPDGREGEDEEDVEGDEGDDAQSASPPMVKDRHKALTLTHHSELSRGAGLSASWGELGADFMRQLEEISARLMQLIANQYPKGDQT